MEFSYQISESDYVSACKLAIKSRRSGTTKTILFWAFIVICLVLLFGVITRQKQLPADSEVDSAPVTQQASSGEALMKNIAPLVGILVIWGFIVVFWLPRAGKRMYRRDTNLHGAITVTMDAESFAFRSTVGTSIQSRWSVFNGWLEKRDIVLLRYPNGTFQILNLAGLSEVEREQLRSILKTVLPQKK